MYHFSIYISILHVRGSRLMLKFNCKQEPADGVVRAQIKYQRYMYKCIAYRGGDNKKCNGHRKRFQKKMNNVNEKRVVTPTFCVMKWKWQAYSTLD